RRDSPVSFPASLTHTAWACITKVLFALFVASVQAGISASLVPTPNPDGQLTFCRTANWYIVFAKVLPVLNFPCLNTQVVATVVMVTLVVTAILRTYQQSARLSSIRRA